MLQLVGLIVVVLMFFLGFDSAGSLARGDISMREAAVGLRERVVRLLNGKFEHGENQNLAPKIEKFSGTDTGTVASKEIYQPDTRSHGASAPVPQGSDGKTTALARKLLKQSQTGN